MSFDGISQPYLTVEYTSSPRPIINKGEHLNFSFKIKNTGSLSASPSHAGIYLSTSNTFSGAALIGEISTESILSNSETKNITYIHPIPFNLAFGNYYLIVYPDSRREVYNNASNIGYVTVNTININSNSGKQNLPYPMLFIHGLNGNDKTWNTTSLVDMQKYYGWSYGGNLDYCLNQDGSLSTSNSINDIKDWTDSANLNKADMYTVNFEIDHLNQKYQNTNVIQSNQAGVVKQGLAIKDAIRHILKITGRDKVILVGHSMGGLAAREYLQNLTQEDGKHHVAKLCTVGTPHGGSNLTGLGIGESIGYSERSEAVRDLRTTYFHSGDSGVYLFGGIENYSGIKNSSLENYYNVDVNCNGTDQDNSYVIGLNDKNIDNNVDYSCIIGTGSVLGGDGVVTSFSANLNNYYPNIADTFTSDQPLLYFKLWHSDLPKQIDFIVKGLDEPKLFQRAYQVNLDTLYFGNLSIQSNSSAIIKDNDNYAFNILENEMVNFKIYNISVDNFKAEIFDEFLILVYSIPSSNKGFLDVNVPMNIGKYYIRVSATNDASSWTYPYAFKITATNDGICPSSNFIMNANVFGSSYQWQENNGSGFVNLLNNNSYSGATSSTLELINPPTSWYGKKYRCVMNGSDFSSEYILKFNSKWVGEQDTRWENPLNWSCGVVPDANTDVIINTGTKFNPQVNTLKSCRSLTTNPLSQILFKTGSNLTITGN